MKQVVEKTYTVTFSYVIWIKMQSINDNTMHNAFWECQPGEYLNSQLFVTIHPKNKYNISDAFIQTHAYWLYNFEVSWSISRASHCHIAQQTLLSRWLINSGSKRLAF